ncbi:hypothetical protein RA278_29165, partial [Pseudomonas syringae pv. tagetis]
YCLWASYFVDYSIDHIGGYGILLVGCVMGRIFSIVLFYFLFCLPDHSRGETGILTLLPEHFSYVSLSGLFGCVIALPLGVL